MVLTALTTFGQQWEYEVFEYGTVDDWEEFIGNIRNRRVIVNIMGFAAGRNTIQQRPMADGCDVSTATVATVGLFSLRLGNVQVRKLKVLLKPLQQSEEKSFS